MSAENSSLPGNILYTIPGSIVFQRFLALNPLVRFRIRIRLLMFSNHTHIASIRFLNLCP